MTRLRHVQFQYPIALVSVNECVRIRYLIRNTSRYLSLPYALVGEAKERETPDFNSFLPKMPTIISHRELRYLR